MTDVPKAEVVSTHEPEKFVASFLAQVYDKPGFLPFGECYLTREACEDWIADNGYNRYPHRILRLPSEKEAARQPLVDALHKAAVAMAEFDLLIEDMDESGIAGAFEKHKANAKATLAAYRAAVAALAAHDKAAGEGE